MPTLAPPPQPLTKRIGTIRRPVQADRARREASERSSSELGAIREARLDRIQAGKTRLWQGGLRIAQVVNGAVVGVAFFSLYSLGWSLRATVVASLVTVAVMWGFARLMAPRERRLRRHMVCLAQRRRGCVQCGYLLRDLIEHRCPECGLAFDPADHRHILTEKTLHRYSARARLISAVAIVAVLFWIATMAQGGAWIHHLLIAAGLLAAYYGMHRYWIDQARREETGGERVGPACPSCGMALAQAGGLLPSPCAGCGHRLTLGDVFVRPDPHRLADRRVVAIQCHSLVLRWCFLVSVCAGLTLVALNHTVLLRLAPVLGIGRAGEFTAIVGPVLFWAIGVMQIFVVFARRLQRRLRMMFAVVRPMCPRCEAGVSDVRVGEACPKCSRRIPLWTITG